ncbi:MAG: glycosyltransferase [Ignavibacteriales bacterium]|nr:glycosyltransferase [Ignavibacteriales bacterium]
MRNAENAIIIGFTNDVPHYLELSQGLIFPAIREHFPRPIIEAFGDEKKIAIASDLPGIEEIIKDGENGFLFKTFSSEDLARKVNFTKGLTTKERIQIGEKAYESYLEKFSVKNVNRIREIIISIIGE